MDVSKITSLVNASNVPVMGMFSLSLTKILLVFESEMDADNAIKEESGLWSVFDDVRRWSEGELFADRLVWIECFGIHPKCWSIETIRKIGEKWGPMIFIDEADNGIKNITHARLLVRTKT